MAASGRLYSPGSTRSINSTWLMPIPSRNRLGCASSIAAYEAVSAAGEAFTEAWSKGGYTVVQAPGPDVMQVQAGVLNFSVSAPETLSAGRTRTFANEAGHATFFVEVRDSVSGALLGRAVDNRIVGDNLTTWRTSGSNRADFREELKRWAEISVRGVNELKSKSSSKP